MNTTSLGTRDLTDAQRKLVEENLFLVTLHLKRNVSNLAQPRRDREREDLYQEGCLGLMEAARQFEPDRGIAFAPFALLRIRSYVSHALHRRFSLMGPTRNKRHPRDVTDDQAATPRPRDPVRRPRVRQFGEGEVHRLHARPGHHQGAADDTIGDRLREKYDRALLDAAEQATRNKSNRSDRAALINAITEQRLLVPDDAARRPMREIARETGSSFSRVASAEQRLSAEVRRRLTLDPEYHVLRDCARADALGVERRVDEEVERRVAEASVAELLVRMRDGRPAARLELVERVFEAGPEAMAAAIGGVLRGLDEETRHRLLSLQNGRRWIRSPRPASAGGPPEDQVRGELLDDHRADPGDPVEVRRGPEDDHAPLGGEQPAVLNNSPRLVLTEPGERRELPPGGEVRIEG